MPHFSQNSAITLSQELMHANTPHAHRFNIGELNLRLYYVYIIGKIWQCAFFFIFRRMPKLKGDANGHNATGTHTYGRWPQRD